MSARRTLYLHVGPHKTASTYLQKQFAEQEQLAKSQGILYPKVGREYLYGHHNLAWSYKRHRPLIDTTRDQISSNLSELLAEGHNKLLLSSEDFMRLTEAELAELQCRFEAYVFHVLYFRRRGNGLVVSFWQELVKQGITAPLDEFVPTDIVYNKPFLFEEHILRFKTGLSSPVITIFDYNALRSQGANRVLDEFCEVLGVKLHPSSELVNPSLPIEVIELIRAANLYATSLGFEKTSYANTTASLLEGEFGKVLMTHVREKVSKISRRLPAKHFVQVGFPASDDETCHQEWHYVPGNILLDELNSDNHELWQTLKQRIVDGNETHKQ